MRGIKLNGLGKAIYEEEREHPAELAFMKGWDEAG